MTPAEQRLWSQVNRRAAGLTPEVARAILRAFQEIRNQLSESELVRLVSTGQVDRIFDTELARARFDAAFQPVRERMRQGIVQGVKYFSRDLPPKPNVTLAFDVLNPDVITAIRQLESRVITTLQDAIRETVRAYVENGLRDGVSPKAIAKEIRNIVGLAPNQERALRSFRELLETGDRHALKRALRDKRYDKTLDRVLGGEEKFTPDQVDRMVDAYRRKAIAMNAETVARTASSDAVKLGQRLSIDTAVKQGLYDGERLVKTWIGVMDTRERPEHVAMEKQTVPYDQPFSNGEMIPGESTYNCRCIARYTQARAA